MERQRDRRGRSVHGLSGSNCFSVYVGNLSPKVKWRYLKKLFQRFGNVLDVFIPQKRDFSGFNFGFFRFSTIREAETAVLMFGGAWVVDRRIIVNLAKFNSRTSFWRKKRNYSWAVDHTQNNKNNSGDSAANKVENGECSQAETSDVKLGKGKEKLDKFSGDTKVSTEMNKMEVGRRLRITAIIGNNRTLEKGDSDMGNGRSLGECDLVGVNIEKNVEGPAETAEKNENENLLSFSKPNPNWAELLFKNQPACNENESVKVDWEVGSDSLGRKEPNSENINPKSSKTLGLNQNKPSSKNQITSYTKGLENPQSVGGKVLEEGQDTEKVIDWVSSADSEESFRNTERVFFPEWESKRERKKRYGSMNQLQDKVLSEKEKKKRDRAIPREKKNAKSCEFSELFGRSLSESDLVQHWEIVSKKEKKALEVGKSLGVEIDGNEEEVIRELADLDSN
ncbi:hypothetical protein V6N11_052209 [Hibiscus sabdariffa]|uniref:RRM domain-containing protein n=1 Tax=Hibiscus sabdariffa TaxID=183260 RepID=A0ABR2U9B7_9ROSI